MDFSQIKRGMKLHQILLKNDTRTGTVSRHKMLFILPSYFTRIKEFYFILVLVENWVSTADI